MSSFQHNRDGDVANLRGILDSIRGRLFAH